MKTKILKALLTVCLSIWSLGGWANSLHFLSMEDGLSGISVNKILKDHQGLAWIAARDGINTFNGKRISSFDISVCGKPHNTVSDLCEVGGKRIYAVTRDGIIMMEKGNSHFKPVLQEVSRPQCLFADGNLLYIGCMDGLLVYDGKNTKRIPMNSSPEELSNSIRKIVKASDGRIYFLVAMPSIGTIRRQASMQKSTSPIICRKKQHLGSLLCRETASMWEPRTMVCSVMTRKPIR